MQNWLKTVLFCLLIGVVGMARADVTPPAHAHGVHGMLLFGEPGRLFASHLPLYRPPHDWQVVLELEPAAAADLTQSLALLNDGSLLSLEPEPFDLLRLQPGAQNPLTHFRAALYAGHFERGGRKLADLDWRVKRTWVFEPVRVAADGTDHRYFVLGVGPGRQWLLHQVERRPDVDQILRIDSQAPLAGVLNVPALLNPNSADPRFQVRTTFWQDADDLQ